MVGCVLLAAAFGVGWTNWGKFENQETIMQVLMAAILAVVVFLAVKLLPLSGSSSYTEEPYF